MNSKVVGSILMILGTCIGAGMIALPIATAPYSLPTGFAILFFCWLISTLGALALAELCLRSPPGSNLISISRDSFGLLGLIFSAVFYLALMYSLTCAYLSGTGEIIHSILATVDLHLSINTAAGLCLLIFFLVISRGIGFVDKLNRILMSTKGIIYLTLTLAVLPGVHLQQLLMQQPQQHVSSHIITVIITSFGYSVIVPTLTDYLQRQRREIYTAIIIGSLLPLIVYLLWITVIQAVLPHSGSNSLLEIAKQSNTNNALITAINTVALKPWLPAAIETFMTIAIITSFLGVSLALSDFIADGLQKKKRGLSGLLIYGLTFLPPFFIVLNAPSVFIKALSHAGVICLLLFIAWPILILAKQYSKKRRCALSY